MSILPTLILDALVLTAGWLVAQVVFQGYENHVPLAKRIGKFAVLLVLFVAVNVVLGLAAFYALLTLMTGMIVVLHGYWFHHRHGIHWRTDEPRDKYLALIKEVK